MVGQAAAGDASFVPYIDPKRTLPELTVKAILLGIVLSMILGAANMYLGLRVGLTVSASIPAAVISMGILRLFRKRNVLENNMVQTGASAGESLAAGVLFTIPALLLLGYWTEVSYWETTLIALTGGVLGVLFTVPLRRALIVEAQLLFPEGIATSEVLKAGDAGDSLAEDDPARAGHAAAGAGVGALVAGAVVGLLYKFMQSGLQLWGSTADAAARFRDRGIVAFGLDLSPALLGVGYIIGLRIAALVFLGGVTGWLVGIPLYSAFADSTLVETGDTLPELLDRFPEDAVVDLGDGEGAVDFTKLDPLPAAGLLWSSRIRYLGVGAMLVGGLWSLLKLRRPLVDAISGGLAAARLKRQDGAAEVPRTQQELGMGATMLGVAALTIPLFGLYWYATDSFLVAGVMAAIMLVTGFLFSAVGGYMAGLVGSTNNPISGVTILTVLAAAFSLKFLDVDPSVGPAATIMVAAVIASAGAIAADNMQDLKAGYLLGATPKRQQTMQVVGVTAAALVMAPVLQLLHDAYTIGSADLPAPQAGLMQAVSVFVFNGGLPITMVAIGAAIAVALIGLDEFLAARRASFRTPVMPVAVGIYLPVGLSTPIFAGGLLAWALARAYRRPSREPHAEEGLRAGVLFSSGLIAGEALVGILVAGILAYFASTTPAGQAIEVPLFLSDGALVWPGLLMMGYVALVLGYLVMRPVIARRA